MPAPSYIYLKGYPYPQPIFNSTNFIRDITLDNLYQYNKIEARFRDYIYKVEEFQCRITDNTGKSVINSPVFKSDSISNEFLNSLNIDKPGGLKLEIINLKYSTPDSTEKVRSYSGNSFVLTQIYKDSADMLMARYFSSYNLVKSNIRIKIEGNPTTEDIQTIQDISGELNALLTTVKVRIVNHFPSMIIRFDTINKENDRRTGARSKSLISSSQNQFYPLLSDYRIFINTISMSFT